MGAARARPRQPTRQTVTSALHDEDHPDAHPERRPADAVGGQQADRHQQQVRLQRHHSVAQTELLAPVHRGRAGDTVGADVLQRSAVPPQPLTPQIPPRRHDLGRHPTLRWTRHPRTQRLQRQRELVVLGQRQRVVDPSGRPGQKRTACLRHRAQGVGPDHRRGPGQDEDPAELARDDALVPAVLVALELADQPAAVLAVEQPTDRHQVSVGFEQSERHLEKLRGDGGVGVHHQHHVPWARSRGG